MGKIWTVSLLIIIVLLIGVAFYILGQNNERVEIITTENDSIPTSVIVLPSLSPTIQASSSAQSSPAASLMP